MITIKVSEADARTIKAALETAAALEIEGVTQGGKIVVPLSTRVSVGNGRGLATPQLTRNTLIRLAHSVETLTLASSKGR